MSIKKNMLIIFFLLSYTLIFYNLFFIKYFNGNIYSQFPNAKIKQNITNNNSNNNKWFNYTDNKENFTTIIPKEWEIIKSKNNENNQTDAITIFRSPKENSNDIFQDNIVISIKKSDKSIANNNPIEIQTIIKKLAKNNNDFKLKNISNINIDDNQTGKSLKYSFKNLGIDFDTEQIFSILDNKIYIFSLLTEQKSIEKYALVLNYMLKKFKIGK
jgi:light-regulated signal transduction histidine kinase (bacteriophytochrome)